VQAAGDKVPPEGTPAYNRGWAAASLLQDRHEEKLAVTEYLLSDWCWYYRQALVAQESDRDNPRPFGKWIDTAATCLEVRELCQAFLADARVSCCLRVCICVCVDVCVCVYVLVFYLLVCACSAAASGMLCSARLCSARGWLLRHGARAA
jgi:hypothetical protein